MIAAAGIGADGIVAAALQALGLNELAVEAHHIRA
jgi:hypothetical protein